MCIHQTFSDVIEAWPDITTFGSDVGVSVPLVRVWKIRGIPGRYWPQVSGAANVRGIAGVSMATLAAIYAANRQPIKGNGEDAA